MQIEAVSFHGRIEKSLRIESEQKPQVYSRVFVASKATDLNYWLELFFSAGIATLGSMLNGQPGIDSAAFSAVVVMVILTTMLTPPALQWSLNRSSRPRAGR